jgi:hypothetical protein
MINPPWSPIQMMQGLVSNTGRQGEVGFLHPFQQPGIAFIHRIDMLWPFLKTRSLYSYIIPA